jgi:hypothetical protein
MRGKNMKVIAVDILDLSMRNISDNNNYNIQNNENSNNELVRVAQTKLIQVVTQPPSIRGMPASNSGR